MKSMDAMMFLILLTVIQVYGVSIEKDHLQTSTQQEAYLSQLMKIETNFQKQIQSLQTLVNLVNKNVTNFEGYPNIQTNVLQAGISSQRNSIFDINNQLILPLDKKTYDCKLLNQTQVDEINKQINQIQKNTQLLFQKIDSEPACERNYELLFQISSLNLYIDHLAKEVGANCGSPVPKTFYVVNPQNQSFTFGSQGEQGYQNYTQNLLNQQYTKLQCPIATPYPKDNQCISCPGGSANYYDLTKKECLVCENGFLFSTTTKTCTKKIFNSNLQSPNYIGSIPPIVSGIETCPITFPFFNGNNCVNCPANSYFSFTKSLCQACPQGTIFDPLTHVCTFKTYNSNISSTTKNYCCGLPLIDPKAESCPTQSPFFNGKQCISCLLPAYFNLQYLSCSLCPEAQSFSTIQMKCMENKYFQTYFTSYLPGNIQNYFGSPAKTDPLYQKVVSCPQDHPFFTGTSCIDCNPPNYFNFTINKCQICQPQYKFDSTAHMCMKITSVKLNNNMASLNNFVGQIPNFNNQLATCPNDKPFFNGNQCIQCSLPKFADLNDFNCKLCPEDFTFNIQNRQCVIKNPLYYTDVKASNIFYNGDFNEIIREINIFRSTQYGVQQCPKEKPYFNAQTGACINCENQYPLFDYKYNRCIACSSKSSFNQQSRICVMEGAVSATVERMIMNSIGW